VLDDALGGEPGAGTDVDRVETGPVELRSGEGASPHRGRPEERIHPAVIDRRDEPVEPERFLLVLDQADGSVFMRWYPYGYI
jgi:hypothetical protein